MTRILMREGWDKYTNHPADRGGSTKWGITKRAWDHHLGTPSPPGTIRTLSEEDAKAFYMLRYIEDPNFHQLPEPIAELVIDCGVNHGTGTATKWLQTAVGTDADGIIGPVTLAAAFAENPLATYLRIVAYRTKLYGRLVSDDPGLKDAVKAGASFQAEFAAGWNNRSMGFLLILADQLSNS